MANDRLWLVCSACEQRILLGKFYGGQTHSFWSQEEFDQKLEDHEHCIGCGPTMNHTFSIEYESDL